MESELRGKIKQALIMERLSREATTGFEPVMRVLQTLALPLGHVPKKLAESKWLAVASAIAISHLLKIA